jgi:hypothetical protein
VPVHGLKRGRGIAPNHSQPDSRRNQVVSTTLLPFIPWKDSVPFPKESSVGLGTLLDAYGKFHATPEFDPRNVQPVRIRKTDYAIPVPIYNITFHFFKNTVLANRIKRVTTPPP